jgi:hypothetical protein
MTAMADNGRFGDVRGKKADTDPLCASTTMEQRILLESFESMLGARPPVHGVITADVV